MHPKKSFHPSFGVSSISKYLTAPTGGGVLNSFEPLYFQRPYAIRNQFFIVVESIRNTRQNWWHFPWYIITQQTSLEICSDNKKFSWRICSTTSLSLLDFQDLEREEKKILFLLSAHKIFVLNFSFFDFQDISRTICFFPLDYHDFVVQLLFLFSILKI